MTLAWFLVRSIKSIAAFAKRCLDLPVVSFTFKSASCLGGGESKYQSLDGKKLAPKTYQSIKDARQAIRRYQDHTNFIYGTDRFQYQYISDALKFGAKAILCKKTDINNLNKTVKYFKKNSV